MCQSRRSHASPCDDAMKCDDTNTICRGIRHSLAGIMVVMTAQPRVVPRTTTPAHRVGARTRVARVTRPLRRVPHVATAAGTTVPQPADSAHASAAKSGVNINDAVAAKVKAALTNVWNALQSNRTPASSTPAAAASAAAAAAVQLAARLVAALSAAFAFCQAVAATQAARLANWCTEVIHTAVTLARLVVRTTVHVLLELRIWVAGLAVLLLVPCLAAAVHATAQEAAVKKAALEKAAATALAKAKPAKALATTSRR
jgi:hypothetical protein